MKKEEEELKVAETAFDSFLQENDRLSMEAQKKYISKILTTLRLFLIKGWARGKNNQRERWRNKKTKWRNYPVKIRYLRPERRVHKVYVLWKILVKNLTWRLEEREGKRLVDEMENLLFFSISRPEVPGPQRLLIPRFWFVFFPARLKKKSLFSLQKVLDLDPDDNINEENYLYFEVSEDGENFKILYHYML